MKIAICILLGFFSAFVACKNKVVSDNIGQEEFQLDSIVRITASLDSGSSKVTIQLEKYEYGIKITSYTPDSNMANCLHIVQRDKDFQYVFLQGGEYRKELTLTKGTDRYEEKVHKWDDEMEKFYYVSGNAYIGRTKIWEDNVIFDLFISKDSIEYSDSCLIRVLDNNYYGESTFEFVRLADGKKLMIKSSAGPFFVFPIAFDPSFSGSQDYYGILHRK